MLAALSGFHPHVACRPSNYRCMSAIVGAALVPSRFAFAVYASTTAGEQVIGRFSAHHAITTGQVWTTALVLMAFGEVLARVAVTQWRRWKLTTDHPDSASTASTTIHRTGQQIQGARS